MNASFRKLARQGERQKNVTFVQSDSPDDGKRLQKAQDGDIIPVERPESIQEVNSGRISQELMAFSIQVDQLFSKMAGNLDAMGGLGPQSDTARQDAMIASTVSKKSAKMTRAVVDSTVDVLKDLMFYIWNDPLRIYETTRMIQGTDIELMVRMEPENRQGKLEEFNLKIEPYSMQYKSPAERGASLMQIMTQVIVPMMPMLQEQGIGVNQQAFFEVISKYMELPELQHIFEFIGVSMPGTKSEPRQAPTTHRVHERVSHAAGATNRADAQNKINTLMGGQNRELQASGA